MVGSAGPVAGNVVQVTAGDGQVTETTISLWPVES